MSAVKTSVRDHPRVLHVFYDFLPKLNGSCIRSAGLVSGQLAQGIPLAAISSPFQPGFGQQEVEEYKGARVYRAYRAGAPVVSDQRSSVMSRMRKVFAFPKFSLMVMRIARSEGADLIHAHSTFYCALAGWIAARLLGLKFVYEFRAVWEERAKGLGFVYRLQGRLSRFLETLSLRLADRVVAINEGLKSEVVSRGIRAAKVCVVPNGVDDELIDLGGQLQPPERATRFGYAGSQTDNEGLEVLVDAFVRAFPNGEDVRLLFFGNGPYHAELNRRIAAANDARIEVRGAFARESVQDVYRSIDCAVLPRHRSKLNDTVTPLKPLEAMAFNRLVMVSDVGGLVEVIGERRNACVFAADDADALAAVLRQAYSGEVAVSDVTRRGRNFVCEHRAWSSIAVTYTDLYHGLLAAGSPLPQSVT